MAHRCAVWLALLAQSASAAGHSLGVEQQNAQLRISLEELATTEVHAAEGAWARLEHRATEKWDMMNNDVVRMGKLEAPFLMSMVERYKRQEPAPSPHEPLEGEAVSPVVQIVGLTINLFIFALFACCWVSYRKVPEGDFKIDHATDYNGNWKHSCWTCYEEPMTCCCAMCCLPLRWAETISFMKGMLPFWGAFFLFGFLFVFQGFTPLALLANVILIIVGIKHRQELRRKFNFDSQGGCSYFTDCLLYIFCMCCAVIQEARHVEDALAAGHEQTECLDRERSNVRSDCWTRRFFSTDGAKYADSEEA